MHFSKQLAEHIRQLHFGKNWTASSMKEQTSGLTWLSATQSVEGCNSIATLVFHTNYYVKAITQVLKGGPLDARDKYSFAHSPISSQDAWGELLNQAWSDAEELAGLVEGLSDEQLMEDFSDGKYGNNHRNILGLIEHTHYHLGQIAVLKKIILSDLSKNT